VATFDSATTLGACLDSVVGQDLEDVELVAIDGASNDGTVRILEAREDDLAYWISEPDAGVYEAWNKALDHVSGEWVTFLGSDDEYVAPDVLSRMSGHLDAHATHRVVYGAVTVSGNGDATDAVLGGPWAEARAGFREHMTIPHPATFHHRSLFDEHGRFDPTFRVAGDYEFLLRELLDRDALFVPDLVVARMGGGGLSNRPDLAELVLRESHRARYMHGLVGQPAWRSPAFYRQAVHGRIRRRFGLDAADRVGDLYRTLTRQGGRRS
jgi:glycosyltransferase involved in cell wall biosynthesis